MDNRQYRQIVDDYADMVYRIALNQTRRVPDAEDVVQAVFLKLYEKPPAWLCDKAERDSGRAMAAEAERGAACDERLRAWLIRVTVNECKSLWRSLWRQRVELREIRDGDAPPFEGPLSPSRLTRRCTRLWARCPKSAALSCTCSTSRTWAPARSPRCWASRNPRCAPGSSEQGSY